jgi:HK97 family phage portal protein
MNLFNRMFSTTAAIPAPAVPGLPEEKASRAFTTHVQRLPKPVWTPHNYDAFCKEGFDINVVAYQAISKIANAIGSMKWAAYDQAGKKLDSHPFLNLINRPNTMQSGKEWWRAKTAYFLLSGNGYDERILNGTRPIELWTLRPDRFHIVPARSGVPATYIYKIGNQEVVFAVNVITGDSDVRHMKMFSPRDDWYGASPMKAAAYAIDQHNQCMIWLQSLLQNAAMPSGALTLDKETMYSEEQYNRLKNEVEENYTGAKNAGRPMLLEGGMKWQSMGLSPAEMEIINLKDSAARDISLAFGVPPLLLNIPGDNTFANYKEARLGFFEDTVIPLADMMAEELNTWLSPYFGNVSVRPDYDSIEAIAEKRREQWELVDTADEITVNEARALKGFPPLPAPTGNMLMADLRSTRRGHESDRSNNPGGAAGAEEILGKMAYGTD